MSVLDKLKPKKKKKLSYREIHGTTRTGDMLRKLAKVGKNVSPVLFDLAARATGIQELKELASAIRNDDKLSDLDKQILLQEMENDMIEMQEVTERLRIDSEHSITRLVRPVVYFSMFVLFLSIVLLDGNLGDFTIDRVYIPVIEDLFKTMTMFYYGSRGIEKIARTLKE